MKTRYVIALAALAAGLAATALPVAAQVAPQEGGMLRTMPHGKYECALPGDASSVAFEVVDSEEFRLGAASSYRNSEGRGVYILRGNSLTFTRGPKKGERFRKVGTNQLRKLDAKGEPSRLLCTRQGRSG